MAELSIRTESLTKKFGEITAVDSVDLSVPEGSIYAFLGPNGAGKTTTIRLLLGLSKPASGLISILGRTVKNARLKGAAKIGSLVEGPSLYPHLSGEETLRLFAGLLEIEKPEQQINRLLKLLDLEQARKRLVKTWSFGMKQRLGLAAAMLNEPRLMILDEPTNGLDPAGIQHMRSLLKRLPGEFGMTIFLSSHLLDEVNRIATHAGIINHGKLIFQGTIAELRKESPTGLYIRCDDLIKAEAIATDNGYSGTRFQQGLLCQGSEDDSALARLSEALISSGIRLYEFSHHTANLEDLFNLLTNDGGKDKR